MALCGYNKMMIAGLKAFADGLWIQALKRAVAEQKTLSEILKLEIAEMDIYEKELSTAKNQPDIEDTLGILKLARFFYYQCLTNGSTETSYNVYVDKSLDRQEKGDVLYYGKLRSELGPEEGLKELAKWFIKNPLN